MTKLLHIDSSILGGNSVSRQLTAQIVASWKAGHPGTEVSYLDLAQDTPTHLSAESLGFRMPAGSDLSDAQKRENAVSEALVSQFSAYQAFPDLAVDGKLTLTENLADLAGLVSAFDAHRRALGSRAADKDFVRQQDRQFFIAFARSSRSKSRDDGIRAQIATDTHAPDTYRIATVRNLDAWYEAFDVRPGQRLYLEPRARVRVW